MASILRSSVARAARVPASRTFATSSLRTAAAQPFFSNEPSGPTVTTAIPGPKDKQAIEELDKVFDVRSLNMIANYQKSTGN